MKSYPGKCPDCSRYRFCSELCEKAEKYVDQGTLGKNNKTDLQNREILLANGNEHLDMMYFHYGIPWDDLLAGNVWYDEIELLEKLKLPEQYILVARMIYLEGRNYQEIGDRLSVSRERIRIIHSMIGEVLLKKLADKYFWDKYLIHHCFSTRLQQDVCQMVFKMSLRRYRVSEMLGVSDGYVGRVTRKHMNMYESLF